MQQKNERTYTRNILYVICMYVHFFSNHVIVEIKKKEKIVEKSGLKHAMYNRDIYYEIW